MVLATLFPGDTSLEDLEDFAMGVIRRSAYLVQTLLLLSGACAVQAAPEDIVTTLRQRYDNTVRYCDGKPSRPAFLCSGLVIRGLFPSEAYKFYEPSPASIRGSVSSGGISASYLRRDANFPKLAYGYTSAVILNNVLLNPADHADPNYLCFFPVDGASEFRADRGCGDSDRTGAREGWCQDEKVLTVDQWDAQYRSKFSNHSAQCAFDVRDERNDAAGPAFYAGIQAMARITEKDNIQNELRIATWKADPPRSPSLLAAAYTDPKGLWGAQLYQRQWWQETGQLLPIVEIRLPKERGGHAEFIYNPKDQLQLAPTIQSVPPAASTTVPVVVNANPSATATCQPYIQSARWTYEPEPGFIYVWRLEVIPTPCGRQVREDQSEAFFNELQSRHFQDAQWKDNPANPDRNIASMHRQLACHLQLHRQAPMWTLEPARRNVDHTTAISKDCNF